MDAIGNPGAGRPVLDIEGMRERLGDDDELVAEIIRLYLDDAPLRLESMASAIRARDSARLGAEAHTLKGSASALSAQRVVDAALALELSAKTDDFGLAEQRFAALTAEAERLAAALHAFQAERS